MKVWDARPLDAEPPFAEVLVARQDATVWTARGQFHLMISEPADAAADFVQALLLGDRDPTFLAEIAANDTVFDHVHALLPANATTLSIELLMVRAQHHAKEGRLDQGRVVISRAGDLPWEDGEFSTPLEPCRLFALLACLEKISAGLNKCRQTTNPRLAKAVAWACVLAPSAVADRELPVRLAEVALKGYDVDQNHSILNTLGAALYRAGRFEDAIHRLEDGIRLRIGASVPQDWAFLAMAHHRLGHRDEARRWLDRFRDRQPEPDAIWDELEIRLLRSEAEAVILYDQIFPADPFAD